MIKSVALTREEYDGLETCSEYKVLIGKKDLPENWQAATFAGIAVGLAGSSLKFKITSVCCPGNSNWASCTAKAVNSNMSKLPLSAMQKLDSDGTCLVLMPTSLNLKVGSKFRRSNIELVVTELGSIEYTTQWLKVARADKPTGLSEADYANLAEGPAWVSMPGHCLNQGERVEVEDVVFLVVDVDKDIAKLKHVFETECTDLQFRTLTTGLQLLWPNADKAYSLGETVQFWCGGTSVFAKAVQILDQDYIVFEAVL